MAAYPHTPDNERNRSLIGLFSDLFRETSTLVHEEVQLARVEIGEKVSQLGSGVAAIGAGGAILFAGFIVLLFAAVNGLAMFLPPEHAAWLAPLIIGLIVMIAGYIALAKGRSEFKAENMKPSRTLDSLRRDTEVVKGHLHTSKERLT
jgi:hypothetical protein